MEEVYVLTKSEFNKFRNKAYQNGIDGLMPIDALNNYPEPIHIPTDEEIIEVYKNSLRFEEKISAAKWMRDQIFKKKDKTVCKEHGCENEAVCEGYCAGHCNCLS